MAANFADFDTRGGEFGAAWKQLQKKVMRARVIAEGVRLDGRGPKDIRPLSAEVDVLKRAHGSALFSRGDTQVLNITTLGMLRMTQMIDTLDLEDSKRYMHHYNFPPYSTGETGRVGSPRRREIGHGALAERALMPVVPNEEEFPYALRLVSDVLSSNGSTSMASVCGSTLSLMDAGVPIKAPVAGIAMGMIADDGQYVTLTDILGAEDALGDMDFKVAGTREFVTAIQLDMKVTGLPGDVLAGALQQARDARFQILDVMEAAIAMPREEVNSKAPRIIRIQIPVDKIGEVIGPKGKRINEIIAQTGADIDIQDDGTVFIGSELGGEGADQAAQMIDEIANPRPVLVGEQYDGMVVKTTTFGAFVNLVPGRDGLVHISKLGRGKRLSSVEEAIKEGDKITVLVEDIDAQGKISLKPVGEEWAIPEGQADESGGRPRGDRGSRGGGDRGGSGGGGSREGGRDRSDRGDRRGKRFRDDAGSVRGRASRRLPRTPRPMRRPARRPPATPPPPSRRPYAHRAHGVRFRPACGHGADAQRPLRVAWASGCWPAPATRLPRSVGPATSWSICSSRAPAHAQRATDRARTSTRWGATSTRSPPRSTRATTPGCATATWRWRSIISPTWSSTP